jgi:hypothetical protein
MTMQPASRGMASGGSSSSGLADVIDTILDKGLVIDAFVRVSLVGIEVLTIDARVVVASVDTYLRFAEAANRLDLSATGPKGVPELVQDAKAAQVLGKEAQGSLEASGGDELEDLMDGSFDEREEQPRQERAEQPRRARRREEG